MDLKTCSSCDGTQGDRRLKKAGADLTGASEALLVIWDFIIWTVPVNGRVLSRRITIIAVI